MPSVTVARLLLPGLPQRISQFCAEGARWWIGELAAMLPRFLRTGAQGGMPKPTVLHLLPADIPATDPIADAPMRGWATSTPTLPERRHAIVELGGTHVLTCMVDLPSAAEKTLSSIMNHQIDKLVPIDPVLVTCGWAIKTRDPARGSLRIRFAAARHAVIDRAIVYARTQGYEHVAVRAGSDVSAPVYLHRADLGRQARGVIIACRLLEVITALSLMAALVLYLHRLDVQRHRLEDQITQLAADTSRSEAVVRAASRLTETIQAIQARQIPSALLRVLNDLSNRLPADAWLSEIDFLDGKTTLSGEAPRATAIRTALARSLLLDNLHFTAPITASGLSGLEHFELGANVQASAP